MKRLLLPLLMFGMVTLCDENVTRKHLAPCNKHEEVINVENSEFVKEVLAADDIFEETYVPQPDMFSVRKAAIITCMDYRLNDFLSQVTPGTYILRNAGGRVTEDWIRSIIILYKLLQVEQIMLIQHTDCGMQKFTDRVMNKLLRGSLVMAKLVKDCNSTLCPLEPNSACKWVNTSSCCGTNPCKDGCIDWHTINHGLADSMLEDVKKIRNHPLIPSNIPVYAYIFDVLTGDLIPVPKAMKAGRAKPLYCKKK